VERVEVGQAESIGTFEQVHQLATELGRGWISGMPTGSEYEKVGADQLETAIRQRFVDHDLGPRGIQNVVGNERQVDVVQSHCTRIRAADAAEHQRIALRFRDGHVFETLGRVAHDFHEVAGRLAVAGGIVLRPE
jgi:hypothetical protein